MSLFDDLVTTTQATIDRRGRAHADCPFCGKAAKARQTHFSFWQAGKYGAKAGYKCFICGAGGGLRALAEHLEITPPKERESEAPAEAPKPRTWQKNPGWYLERFCGALDRVPRWQAYKPLTLETIGRWRLGVGVLPSSPCPHKRLIYPQLINGQPTGFRGRAIDCSCDKWMTAGGGSAWLWGAELLHEGATVIIAENPVDAMLAMQETPDIVAVAGTAGASTWKPEWTRAIAASRPARVLEWFDNDLAGHPNAITHELELARWKQEMEARVAAGKITRLPAPPKPNGPRVVHDLQAAGVNAYGYTWPPGTPVHADLGQALIQSMRAA